MLRIKFKKNSNHGYSTCMEKILDIYTDYLHTTFGNATATGLSQLLDGTISHDRITRMLSSSQKTSKDLWLSVKPLVSKHENDNACLIFDDSIIEKQYTDSSELICWHWDHSKGRNIKGINLLSAFYYTESIAAKLPLRVPIDYKCISKPILYSDLKTRKEKRKSEITKNELMRNMIQDSLNKQLKFKYVLADSWFSSTENIEFIDKRRKYFIFDIKQNRLAALNQIDKRKGNWTNISELDISNETPVKVLLKGCSIELLLIKQVFTNKDSSQGVRYLISNDINLSSDDFKTIYKKRWSVEEYHKSLKQNNAIGKSPTRTIITQTNHLFASMLSYVKLEKYKLTFNLNHFAVRGKLYAKALKSAFEELNIMKTKLAQLCSA
jgi:hypothetical protein